MIYYMDSSALVKIYIQEQGSEWTRELLHFASADKVLNDAATNEGLTVINPNEQV